WRRPRSRRSTCCSATSTTASASSSRRRTRSTRPRRSARGSRRQPAPGTQDGGRTKCAVRRGTARRGHIGREHRKNCHRITIASSDGSRAPPKLGYRVAPAQGGLVMAHDTSAALEPTAALDRLGDEIAELSAHLDAATAQLLELIREFDARGGWNTGFLSCAGWLTWRVGLDPGAARERVRVARAFGTLPRLAQALARGELSYAKVRALRRGRARSRGAAARGGSGGER